MQVDNQCCSFESIFIFYVHLIEDMDQTELCDIWNFYHGENLDFDLGYDAM
jgi:hypothetical protein